jgi:hypothetical protein
MTIESIVEKLKALNVFPDTVNDNAEIFLKVQNEEDIEREMTERHTSCGHEQYIFFHFHSLLKLQPEILKEAEEKLGNSDISINHVREYMQAEQQPSLLLALRHDDKYPYEVRERFREKANQFALDKIKEYLGIKNYV